MHSMNYNFYGHCGVKYSVRAAIPPALSPELRCYLTSSPTTPFYHGVRYAFNSVSGRGGTALVTEL